MKRRIAVTLDGSLIKAIDEVRGPVNRSNFIELLIREAIKDFKPTEKPGGSIAEGKG